MKKIVAFCIAVLLKAVGRISSLLSVRIRLKLGKVIGTILRLSSKKRYVITVQNLAAAYPEMNELWHVQSAKSAYNNLGIVLAEILAFEHMSNDKLADLIKFTNLEVLQKAHSLNKGMILLSGHFGNWELLAYAAGLFSGIPINIVVAPQHNSFANEYINIFRTRHNNSIVPMTNAARNIVQLLKNKGVVALLADQSASTSKDLVLPFFNRPAATYEAPATFALKFNIPLIIGFAVRQPNGKYIVSLEEVNHQDLENTKQGIAELTKRHVEILERTIRLHPEQWSWQHKRWKS